MDETNHLQRSKMEYEEDMGWDDPEALDLWDADDAEDDERIALAEIALRERPHGLPEDMLDFSDRQYA